jgi:hypothetical protein
MRAYLHACLIRSILKVIPRKKKLTVTERAKLGGKARAKSMQPKDRSESARKAARARWGKKDA